MSTTDKKEINQEATPNDGQYFLSRIKTPREQFIKDIKEDQNLQQSMLEFLKIIRQDQEALKYLDEQNTRILKAVYNALSSFPPFDMVKSSWLEDFQDEELVLFIERELRKKKYEGKTLHELLDKHEINSEEPPVENLLMQAVAAAKKTKSAAEEALSTAANEMNEAEEKLKAAKLKLSRAPEAEKEEVKQEVEFLQEDLERSKRRFSAAHAYMYEKNPFFTGTPNETGKVEFPVDKINANVWSWLTTEINEKKNTPGQYALGINLAKQGANDKYITKFSIDFNESETGLRISKHLDGFDKRVYIAAAALFNAGNIVITLSQIYSKMGFKGKPTGSYLEKINDSITKMTTAHIWFDNITESSHYDYPRFKYDGSLLPMERVAAFVKGKFTDAAIHLYREPPLMQFARERKQITTIPVELLQSPVSKTDMNLKIEDYLIDRLSKAKRNKEAKHRILFTTIFKYAEATTHKQKERIPEKTERYLSFYKEKDFIKDFKIDNTGITIFF